VIRRRSPAMPRSSSSPGSGSKRILGRAMAAILALPLTPITKAKLGLLLFKKRASAAAGRRRCYKPFRHYNYAYVGEYQFSPSRSPLLPAPPPGVTTWRRAAAAAARRRRGRARMVLASLFCGGGGADELDVAVLDGLARRTDGRAERDQLVVLAPALEWARGRDDGAAYACSSNDEDEEVAVVDYGEEGDVEVDDRAERFIERFYQEMRLQRQRSLVQRLL
jgi:hypothetical protein